MKKNIILSILVVCLCAASAFAQTVPGATISSRGWTLYQDGQKMTSEQIKETLDDDNAKLYRSGKRQMLAGTICIPAGVGVAAAGATCGMLARRLDESSEHNVGKTIVATIPEFGLTVSSYICYGVGGAAVVTGIVLLCTGSSTIKNVTCNANNGKQVALAPASNGVGLALRF